MSQILTFYIDIADNLPYTEVRRLSIMFERMKAARKALRLTQEYVARQMGMSRTTIVAIEAGEREVTATELTKFADLYGVPME
jgi:transcriptional regulator with XRE-family HTH domain